MGEPGTVLASGTVLGPLGQGRGDRSQHSAADELAADELGQTGHREGDAVEAVGVGLAVGFRAAALSSSTRAAYRGDWARFRAWSAGTGVASLPADPVVVAEYLAQAASLVGQSGRFVYTPATLARRLAAVNAAHRAAGARAPGDDPAVAATMRGIRATRRQPRRRAKPVGLEQLRTVLGAIDRAQWPAGVIGARDTAILLLGFAGALRRSELAALRLADVELTDGALTLRIRSSKTDQQGEGHTVGYPRGTRRDTCAGCAVLDWAAILHSNTTSGRVGVLRLLHDARPAAGTRGTRPGRVGHSCTDPDQLRAWREMLDADPDVPLLRPVTKAATIPARPVSDATVDDVLRRRLRGAGIDPAGFSAHSLRAGFITEALTAGANHHEVMRQTRHASPATVELYARHYTPLEANAVTRIGL